MPRFLRSRSSWLRFLLFLGLGLIVEDIVHQYHYYVPRPSRHLDPPFSVGCQEPNMSAPRENATIIMLAQNEDLDGAAASMQSLEDHFNQWYHYPVIFMNNEPWTDAFITTMSKIVSGESKFEVIPPAMFGFPDWIDPEDAKRKMAQQGTSGIHKGGLESYHHMCRFYSGKFYDVEALRSFKWYWRVEPHVRFSCAVTYDPFVEMAKRGKRYGYTIALWELDNTVPQLFRLISDYKRRSLIGTTNLWKSMVRPSWILFPFRNLFSSKALHDSSGDAWNLCHFWSNFEIADMDFFRSDKYRKLFEFLDYNGGFYSERWGDASVHSLAAALLLSAEELHHFQDFGYSHDPWVVCPANAWDRQLPYSETLNNRSLDWMEEKDSGVGCRCKCKEIRNFQNYCFNRVQRATHPVPWANKIGW